MNQQNMIVIGGGASGLTAAICALRAGLDVCVLEAEATVCKKLAATGNGKCNFTHAGISGIEYYSDQPDLIREILTDYPTEHILSFASSLGISYVEKNGYFYPHAQQASAVCKALQLAIHELGGRIRCQMPVERITKDTRFHVTANGEVLDADVVVLATGSRAGDFAKAGDPYEAAYHWGLPMEKPLPALVKVQCSEPYCRELAGLRAQAAVTLSIDETVVRNECGEVQFTEQGLSGIVIFQVSGAISQALTRQQRCTLSLDLYPEETVDTLISKLQTLREQFPNRRLQDALCGMVPEKLAGVLCGQDAALSACSDTTLSATLGACSDATLSATLGTCSDAALSALVQRMKHFVFHVQKTAPLKSAQVARGGVLLSALSAQLEVRDCPGLYLCGELLNVDGPCGGYNLHWAFASGMHVGQTIGKIYAET